MTDPTGLPMTQRMSHMESSLEGLSLGDAFGQQFFRGDPDWVIHRRLPPKRAGFLSPPHWAWTDDTAMAIELVAVLRARGLVDQDLLARAWASRYMDEPGRGYGPGAHELLRAIDRGHDWRVAARRAFHGEGSLGNGGAMRVAPLGAYFAGDMGKVVEQAMLSAEITHAHQEGIAGAVAVAVAAAVAAGNQGHATPRVRGELLDRAIDHTPPGMTQDGLIRAREIPRSTDVIEAVHVLGNGSRITAPDTVPFALWCAARHLDDFEEALWTTISAGGDMDTNGAIVGGIVACMVGREKLPAEWLARREPL